MAAQTNNQDGQPPRPKLPDWTVAERQVWAASHRLPKNIMLIYGHEMARMQQAVIQSALRAKHADKVALNAVAELKAVKDEFAIAKRRLDYLEDLEAGRTPTP